MRNQNNVRFNDLVVLLEAFGFCFDRKKGSHMIYKRLDIPKIINIQEDKGQAKPYQVRQFLDIIHKYGLSLEDEK